MSVHSHKYCFDCFNENKHNHRLMGYTESMVGFRVFHFHRFKGVSSYCGHIHYFSGTTGPPIRTGNGHMHKMEGLLELEDMHTHRYKSYTSEDVEYIPKKEALKPAFDGE